MRTLPIALFVSLALLAGAVRADAPKDAAPVKEEPSARAWIAHLPISSAPLDDVRLRFDVRGGDVAGEIIVYYRALAQKSDVRSARAQRDEKSYGVLLPAASIASDAIGYWVVERMPSGEERAVFASADAVQVVHITVDDEGAREKRLLRLAGGRRSRLSAKFDWVDMGGFKVANPKVDPDARDHYYHFEGQYAYRFYRAVEELEVGIGALDGKLLDTTTLERERVALQYGRAAITFALGEWLRLRPGVLLGFSTTGFEAGGDLAAIVGDRDGTEFELSGGIVGHLGGRVGIRLGWATVPRFPMGARVDVLNFPSGENFGVRLTYDVGFRISDALLVRATLGYRGRTSLAGGPVFGLEASYGF